MKPTKKENENENSDNKFIQCSNCKQNILSSNMFLHEGFCLRNNTYCLKCKKVILKKDYETHIKNNCEEIQKEPQNTNKEHNLVIKDITEEEEQKKKQPITINQINYNACVNMNFPPVPKNKEIIKINDPIIISTNGDNKFKKEENYQDYFLQYYNLSNYFSENSKPYLVQKVEKIDSRKTSDSSREINEKNFYNCQKILNKTENIPKNDKKNFLIEENDENIIKNCNDYNFNNLLIRKTLTQKNNIKKDESKCQSDDSSNEKMPLDRVSRKIKKSKTQKNTNINNQISQTQKPKIPKYEKCEYCNRVTQDLNLHNYRCEARRLFEIGRIQTKQDENEQKEGRRQSVIMKSNTILLNIPKSAKRDRINSDFDEKYFKNKLKEKVENIMKTQTRNYNKNKNKRICMTNKREASSKTLRMKFPESREENCKNFEICI